MKRFFLIISMIACLCVCAVCPVTTVSAVSESETYFTEEEYMATATAFFETIVSLDAVTVEQYIASGTLDEATSGALSSWNEQRNELGEYVEIIDSDVTISKDSVTMEIKAQFTNRQATFTLVTSPDMTVLSAVSLTEVLTMGEIFKKAALNTLMGMGTVFMVLILIAFIISLFKYIPKIQEMFAKKNKAEVLEESAVIEPAEQEEELVDDTELVAVIMAAIYASMEQEGKAVSKDGLIVRSIRRSRR